MERQTAMAAAQMSVHRGLLAPRTKIQTTRGCRATYRILQQDGEAQPAPAKGAKQEQPEEHGR